MTNPKIPDARRIDKTLRRNLFRVLRISSLIIDGFERDLLAERRVRRAKPAAVPHIQRPLRRAKRAEARREIRR